jgi:hypothetical protein
MSFITLFWILFTLCWYVCLTCQACIQCLVCFTYSLEYVLKDFTPE